MADDRFYVKTLRLQNFRCFEDVELGPFDPHFNLLIGENGAGKSSVLMALSSLFAMIAAPFLATQKELVGLRDTRGYGEPRAAGQGAPPRLELAARYRWSGSDRTVGLRCVSDMMSIMRATEASEPSPFSAQPDRIAPLAAVFTTSRRFRRDIPRTGDPEPSRQFERGDAFRDWDEVGISVDELLRWARDETLIDFERAGNPMWRTDETALALTRRACKEAIEGAEDFFYNGTQKDIVVAFAGGRKAPFSNMSDGQRAVVGLVADLVRRIHLLNGAALGGKILSETPGLVLIDEIDLHLHPKWQRDIVPALKRIFPKIQFFATTHSPQVIGEAKPHEIVLLTPHGQKHPTSSYGMDSNWILECVMEAEGRDPGIALRLKNLFNLIEDEKFDEARKAIKALRKDIGDGPDIVGAEAYLWRMEHLGDEAAE